MVSSNPISSGKITRVFKPVNSLTGIKEVTKAQERVSEKTEVLGTSDKKIPALSIIGGILLILAGILVFILKYMSLEEIYEKIFNEK